MKDSFYSKPIENAALFTNQRLTLYNSIYTFKKLDLTRGIKHSLAFVSLDHRTIIHLIVEKSRTWMYCSRYKSSEGLLNYTVLYGEARLMTEPRPGEQVQADDNVCERYIFEGSVAAWRDLFREIYVYIRKIRLPGQQLK